MRSENSLRKIAATTIFLRQVELLRSRSPTPRKKLDVRLSDKYREYLSECGLLMAFGFELHGIGLDGSAAFVEDTLRLREKGPEKHYVVIRNIGEYVDCLDVSTGESDRAYAQYHLQQL